MQLRADSLPTHLKQGLAPFYLLHGDEPLLMQEAADAIRAAARAAGYLERLVYTTERNFDWRMLDGISHSVSLFGERRLLELRIPTAKPGQEGSAILEKLASEKPVDQMMLIILPRLTTALQKAAWFIALERAGVAIRIDAVTLTQLPAWINHRLRAQGQQVQPGQEGQRALQFMTERVEGNLLAAHQEIQKLGLLYPPGELKFEQIYEAVLNVARYDVFKLNEAMLAGDRPRLARMLEGLRGEGEAPALVLWAVVEEIRVLIRIKRGLKEGKSIATLLRENRVWGPREKLITAALSQFSEAELESNLAFAARLDRQLKGLSLGTESLPANIWDGLFELALKLSQSSKR